jgi:hypothetical protein
VITIELIAGPWDGRRIEHHHQPTNVAGPHGDHYWTYSYTGRSTPDGAYLWALTSATPQGVQP